VKKQNHTPASKKPSATIQSMSNGLARLLDHHIWLYKKQLTRALGKAGDWSVWCKTRQAQEVSSWSGIQQGFSLGNPPFDSICLRRRTTLRKEE
jgi:hypothetical protein